MNDKDNFEDTDRTQFLEMSLASKVKTNTVDSSIQPKYMPTTKICCSRDVTQM